jgi:hypothetical protein
MKHSESKSPLPLSPLTNVMQPQNPLSSIIRIQFRLYIALILVMLELIKMMLQFVQRMVQTANS